MNAKTQLASSGSTILSSLDAVRNVRALLLVFGSLGLAGLIFGFGAALAGVSFVFPLLFTLAGALVAFYGMSAAGIVLMDEAKGLRTTARDALAQSLFTSHRLLLVGLMVGLLYLAGMLVILLALAICKIPFLGPILYTLVFPISVLVCGVAVVALYFVVGPLAAPAVWDGATTMQAISRLYAIARSRLLKVLMMMVLLTLLCGVVVGVVAFIIFTGTLVTAGLSTPVLGASSLMAGLSPALLYGMGGGVGSYVIAAMIGGGVLYAMAFSLPALIYVRGCCSVYLENSQGVDVAGAEQKINIRIVKARERAEALRHEQRQAAASRSAQNDAAQAARASTYVPAGQVPSDPMPPGATTLGEPLFAATAEPVVALRCPACSAPRVPTDKFCGSCGERFS